MAPEIASDGSSLTYEKAFEEELESCRMPKVTDPNKATTEDLLRDIHGVLTGNGGTTRGLIYKTCATRASIRIMRNEVAVTQGQVSDQQEMCLNHQNAKALVEAERRGAKKVAKTLWDNRGVLLTLVLAIFIILNRFVFMGDSGMEKKIEKLVATRLEKLIDIEYPGDTE